MSSSFTSKYCCPECQSEDIINDTFVSVCSNCGNVVNDSPDTVEKSTRGNSYQSKGIEVNCSGNQTSYKNQYVNSFCRDYTSNLKPRISIPIKFGIDLIYNVCNNLNIKKSICEMSVNLFKAITSEKPFKTESVNVKQCLAISCLYLVSNREDNPITFTELCNNTDCIFSHFGVVLLRLEKLYPEIYPDKSKFIESLVPFYLFKLKLEDREKPVIADYASNLVWMWREAALVQGFNPITVIYSALFYGWKAANHDRAKVNVKEFCRIVQIEFKLIIRNRVNFYYKVLSDFIRCNPICVDANVTPQNISYKIKDIVKMKRIILLNYDGERPIVHGSKRKQSAENTEYEDKLFRKSSEKMLRSHIKSEEDDLDLDFSDSEIDSYIRTEAEVRVIETLKQDVDYDD